MSSNFPQPPADSEAPQAASSGLPAAEPVAVTEDAAAGAVAPESAGAAEPVPAEASHAAGQAASATAVQADAPSPAATAQQLKRLFPALFGGQPKPLKLRIQNDIQERAPGQFTKQALTAFFRRYTGSHGYLLAVSRSTHRFDLDGAPAGELADEHRKVAVDELARRRANTESRRELEDEQRRNRATLLHDFERTTLTPANFCALKGISLQELDEYLAVARREAAERPVPPAFAERDRGGRREPDRGGRNDRNDRPPRHDGEPPRRRNGPPPDAGRRRR